MKREGEGEEADMRQSVFMNFKEELHPAPFYQSDNTRLKAVKVMVRAQ